MLIEQVQPRRLTLAEFKALAALPEYHDRIVEFIGGNWLSHRLIRLRQKLLRKS